MVLSQLVEAWVHPQWFEKTLGCSSRRPHEVCMTGRTGGLKNLETWDQALECVRPMKPSPISATLISRIARLLDRLWSQGRGTALSTRPCPLRPL